MWFFLNLYLQQVLGYGAFEGGAALLPMTVTIMVLMVLVAPRVIARFGPKAPIVAGMLVLAAGTAVGFRRRKRTSRLRTQKGLQIQAYSKAADGIRTLDLLHGKQTGGRIGTAEGGRKAARSEKRSGCVGVGLAAFGTSSGSQVPGLCS
jgi:hypothetical protein